MILIAIDPGASGGIAVKDEESVFAWDMESERSVADILAGLARRPGEKRAVLEKVGAHPAQGRTSCFTFGRNYGFVRGCLTVLGIPYEDLLPGVWQRDLGCVPRSKKGPDGKAKKVPKHIHKKKLKAKAEQLYPLQEDITLDTADALLMLEWLRRREKAK